MPKHKHYYVIVAWANGEEIEWSKDGEIWRERHRLAGWFENYYYRVKPKTPMYRLFTYREDNSVFIVLKNYSEIETECLSYVEQQKNVIWLTDWLPLPERKEECLTK